MNALLALWYDTHASKPWWWYALAPLSLLFWALSSLRKVLYRSNLLSAYRAPVPVIIVGNISVGGNGKTPTVLALAQALKQQGYRPAILSRGYGGDQNQLPHQVQQSDTPDSVGDEPLLMAQRDICPVIIDKNRARGAKYLCDQGLCDVIVCDDGMQHYKLARDIEIVVMDKRGLGNAWLMPMGPLRELAQRLNSVDTIVLNSLSDDGLPLASLNTFLPKTVPCYPMHLQGGDWVNVKTGASLSAGHIFVSPTAMAGIGDPQRFFDTVASLGIDTLSNVAFADHHAYRQSDIAQGTVLMTEKDAVKCKQIAHEDCWYLPVQGQLPDIFFDTIVAFLNDIKLRKTNGI